MAILIGRPINGIGINGNEYVCDDNGIAIAFMDIVEAKNFLAERGLTEDDIENQGIVFEEAGSE